jgi:hypothetical protein
MPESPVTIVVDPAFAERLGGAAQSGPVWTAKTVRNRDVAEKLWGAGVSNVTTFDVSEPFDPESAVAGILGQVLLHHPHARELRVVGCSPVPAIRRSLFVEGFEVSEEGREGFVARSTAA